MRFEFSLLTLLFFMALAAGNAWADEAPVNAPDDSSQPTNIDSWQDNEEGTFEDDLTFFGMSYEARIGSTNDPGAAATATAGGVSSASQKGGGNKGGKR